MVMRTAERVVITLGCSLVRKSRALQALRSQTGACATVVEVTGKDGMARHQSVSWFCVNGCERVKGYTPSPCDAAEAGTTAVEVLAGGVVAFEEDWRPSFQKPEELAGSALTTSLLLSWGVADVIEGFEGERVSQVARLLGVGFSTAASDSVDFFSDWDLSVDFLSDWDLSGVALPSATVDLRMGGGFFFSVCFISAGSSETSSFSRPIIHHPEDLVWTRTDSVFLSSMSPITGEVQSAEGKRGGSGDVQPMFLIAVWNFFQSHR